MLVSLDAGGPVHGRCLFHMRSNPSAFMLVSLDAGGPVHGRCLFHMRSNPSSFCWFLWMQVDLYTGAVYSIFDLIRLLCAGFSGCRWTCTRARCLFHM